MDIVVKLTECIRDGTPVSFSKYGDGEYLCASGRFDCWGNCDHDPYTPALQAGLLYAFTSTVLQGGYIGKWRHVDTDAFWQSNVDNRPVNWADYHTFLFDAADIGTQSGENKLALYRAIQQSPMRKIVVCNKYLAKTRMLYRADAVVEVPLNNWFTTEYTRILGEVVEKIGDVPNPIVLTSAGMGAKVLVADLAKKYPGGIFLDIGSGMDLLCTKRDSRGRGYSYDTIYTAFSNAGLLCDEWYSPEYDWIYPEAQSRLGLHLM